MKLRIDELYSSSNGQFVVGGSNTKEAFVWDMEKNELINRFKVSYDSVGERLAVDNSGKYVAAAEYSGGGLTLYCTDTGKEIWTLKEIKQIQRIYFIEDKGILSIISNNNVEYLVNVIGGDIFGDMKCEKVLDSKEDDRIIVRDKGNILYKGMTFDMECICLAGVITPLGIAVAKMGGGLCFFDNEGRNIWNKSNNKNEHILKLAYIKEFNYIAGIIYKYNSPRTEPFFKAACYSVEDGELIYEGDLDNSIDFTFANEGKKILSSIGNLYKIGDQKIDLLMNIRRRKQS